MKPLLNTLYVSTERSYLSREGETVLVQIDGRTRLQVPVHTLSGIVCIGRVVMSPQLMSLCAEKNVGVCYLTEHGRFLARVVGPVNGNVLLRREQYRRSEQDAGALTVAQAILMAKIANSRHVLMRAARERSDEEGTSAILSASTRLGHFVTEVGKAADSASLLGLEGEAAATYFSVFDTLISSDESGFRFNGRTRRPPRDRVNALLSFLYTLLVHDVTSALETVVLDPAVGFLHRLRPGRPALALDMAEEFRAMIADRLAITLINRRQVKPSGFVETESGGFWMDESTRKEVIVAYQQRKQEQLEHRFLDERLPIGLIPHAQAMLMARHLRGDLNAYPAFFWR